MKLLTASSVLVAGVIFDGVSATFFDWRKAPSFSCPQNTDNQCDTKEKSGWTFDDLNTGSFSDYSSFSFKGFTCKANGNSKRGLLLNKRGANAFGGKSISCKASKTPGPKFSCGSDKKGFSATDFYISTDRDVDVEFQYTMKDGSKCSHVSSCKKGGSKISNTQCGGAQDVSFNLPDHEDSDCGIDIHGVDFDCNPPVSPPPQSSAPPSSSSAPPSVSSPPVSSSPALVSSSSTPEVASSLVYSSPSSESSISVPTSSSEVVSVPSSTVESPVSASSPPSTPPPPPSGNSPCPDVLPKCLNTWMFQSKCKDNTDSTCYCKDEKFISSVYGCLSSWGMETAEVQSAITYLVGVCAPFIPTNPGIITNCPSNIPIKPTSPPEAAPTTPPVLITTITVDTTITTCPPGATVTSNNTTTVLETPSVSTAFVTRTITTCDKCNEVPSVETSAVPGVPYTTIEIPQLNTTCTVPIVAFATATGSEGGDGVVLSPTGSPGAGIITASFVLPTSSGLATYPVGSGNFSATATSAGPQVFEGSASHSSVSWLAGTLLSMVSLLVVC